MQKEIGITIRLTERSANIEFKEKVTIAELSTIAAGLLDYIIRASEREIMGFNSDQESHVLNQASATIAVENMKKMEMVSTMCATNFPMTTPDAHSQKIHDYVSFSWPLKASLIRLGELAQK